MFNTQIFRILNECSSTCFYCADACLDEPDVESLVASIRVNRVCGEICSMVSKILSTSFPDVGALVIYCRTICEQCAEECEKHPNSHCELCVKACRACAVACTDFIEQNGHENKYRNEEPSKG